MLIRIELPNLEISLQSFYKEFFDFFIEFSMEKPLARYTQIDVEKTQPVP